jgi:cell division protein FtsQ
MPGITGTVIPRRRQRAAWDTLFRVGPAIGAPMLIVGGVFGAMQLNGSPLEQWLVQCAVNIMVQSSGSLGLTVADITVEGRETTDRETILAALAAGPGTPILGISPIRAKAQLEGLPWVRTAVIERHLPGTIYVRLAERKPLALWQHSGKIQLIDREGAVIRVARLDRFAKLPMVVGEDAAGHAAKLFDMLASDPDLAMRVTAAIRVGDRRWNLRIDNAIDVLLPADETAYAWSELARLERSSAILKRDVQTIDLRLRDRLVLRVSSEPSKEPAISKKARPPAKNT